MYVCCGADGSAQFNPATRTIDSSAFIRLVDLARNMPLLLLVLIDEHALHEATV